MFEKYYTERYLTCIEENLLEPFGTILTVWTSVAYITTMYIRLLYESYNNSVLSVAVRDFIAMLNIYHSVMIMVLVYLCCIVEVMMSCLLVLHLCIMRLFPKSASVRIRWNVVLR